MDARSSRRAAKFDFRSASCAPLYGRLSVLTAQGPIRALFLATTNGEFDFAIVDYEMPMMNGGVTGAARAYSRKHADLERITPGLLGLKQLQGTEQCVVHAPPERNSNHEPGQQDSSYRVLLCVLRHFTYSFVLERA